MSLITWAFYVQLINIQAELLFFFLSCLCFFSPLTAPSPYLGRTSPPGAGFVSNVILSLMVVPFLIQLCLLLILSQLPQRFYGNSFLTFCFGMWLRRRERKKKKMIRKCSLSSGLITRCFISCRPNSYLQNLL